MTTVVAPFGLRPVNHPSGMIRPKRLQDGIASGYGSALYQGVPVMLNSSGNLVIATTNADIVGCFWGVEYTLSGRRIIGGYWPASTVPDTTGDPFYVYYFDDPLITYEIQGAGSYAQTSIGDQADFATLTAGSTVTQVSGAALGTLAGAGVQAQFRITGLALYPNNAWGDTYTIVQGQIARHQYVSNKVGI
jgi:hypothetical protein